MSTKDVETIRTGLAALNRGDVDGMLATLAPDAEMVPLRAVLDGIVYRGHEGLRRWLADMSEDWIGVRAHARRGARADGPAVCSCWPRSASGAARAGSRSTRRPPGSATCAAAKVARIRFFADSEAASRPLSRRKRRIHAPRGKGVTRRPAADCLATALPCGARQTWTSRARHARQLRPQRRQVAEDRVVVDAEAAILANALAREGRPLAHAPAGARAAELQPALLLGAGEVVVHAQHVAQEGESRRCASSGCSASSTSRPLRELEVVRAERPDDAAGIDDALDADLPGSGRSIRRV